MKTKNIRTFAVTVPELHTIRTALRSFSKYNTPPLPLY